MKLTQMQIKILCLYAKGHHSKEIGDLVFRTNHAVRHSIVKARIKNDCKTTMELMYKTTKAGLI